MDSNVFDIILQAGVQLSEADAEIKKYVQRVNNDKNKILKLQIDLDLADTAEAKKKIEKQIAGLKGDITKGMKALTPLVQQSGIDLTKFATIDTKAVQKAENNRLRTVKATNKEIVKDAQDTYNKMLKLNQYKLNNKGLISDADMKEVDSQMSKLSQHLGTIFSKAKGNDTLTTKLSSLKQEYQEAKKIQQVEANTAENKKAAAQDALNKKQQEKEQAQAQSQIEKEVMQQKKQAYDEALRLAREEFQLQLQIQQLENKDRLTSSEKQKLQELQSQLGVVRQLKQENMNIISSDKTRVKGINDATARYERQLSVLRNQNNELDEQNSKTKAIGKNIGDGIKNMVQYLMVYQAIGLIQRGMEKAYGTIKDLDKAFTDIQLVTGQTKQEMVGLTEEYNQLAKSMGATTQQVAEGASEWLRQGKTTEETTKLLQSSMTLSKVGAMESATATELLTSTLNGYKLEAEDAMSVVDAISSIDLEAATSSEELAVALSRTANSADDAGVSFNKLLGMIGTTSSVTRKSASTIGESFKTIFARMSNVAAGKEIDDEGESLNDVETSLNKMGIALRSSQKEWRNFEDVIDEVAEKWKNNEFTSTEKSQIATAIAGTRQQENFRAMMNNWDEVIRLTNVASNSTGSATERMGIYLDSIEAKTNKLKAAWEGFITSLGQSEGFKDLIDWLTKLLEKLEYVDWKAVGMVATIGTVITVLLKLVPAIKTLIAAIKEGGIIAGIASGGIVPILGAVVTLVAAIATAWGTANANAEQQLEEIKKQKEELETEKQSVQDLYKQYSELEGKSKYYALTAEEKQKLVDVSKDLVEKYGLEATGIDVLTGKYQLATDALKDYNEQAERNARVLDTQEKQALKKDFEKTEKESEKTVLYGTTYETDYNNKKINNPNIGRTYYGKQKILDEKEMKHVEDNVQMLANVLYDSDSWDKDWLGNKVLKKDVSEYYHDVIDRLVSDYGIELRNVNSDDYSNKDDFIEALTTDITKQQNELKSATRTLAEKATKYLKSEFTGEVSTSISDIMENSIKQYVANGGGIGENFLEDYKKKFVDMINADGENYSKIVDNYKKLQEKAESGTLGADEYQEYQQGLRTYIELQRQAAIATGMTRKEADEFVQTMASDATNNMNVKLLELRENMKDAKNENGEAMFSEEQVQNFNNYTEKLLELNKQFKDGKISAQDYFNKLQEITNSVDPTNLQQIEETFGNINNYMTTMVSTFQDSIKYITGIWTAFQGGGDSLEFLNNFLPAAQQVQNMADNFLKIEDSINSIDLDTRQLDENKPKEERYDITQSNEEIQQDLKVKLNVDADLEEIEKAKNILNDLDGKSVDVALDGIEDDNLKNLVKQVDDVTDGTADLKNNVAELGDALGDLAELDFNSVDSAFETVSKAFDDLPKNSTSLIGQASNEVKSSAQQMAKWMQKVAESDEAYAEIAKQNIINTMATTGETVNDIGQVSTEALANAYMADAQNTANFAADTNRIAQQAMSTAVQELGKVLSAMGNAIANLDIEIPLSLAGIEKSVGIGPLDIPISIPDINTTFKIGGAGTKGLKDIGNAIKNFGTTLQDDSVANTIASNFTPVQANYTPNNKLGDNGGGKPSNSSHTPSGGGGKNKGSGGKSDADKAKELQEKIDKFREDEGTALEDVTEELIKQYEAEGRKLDLAKKNLEYANDLLDSEEETTKWIENQNKLLTNQRKKIQANYRENSKIDQQLKKIQSENKQYNINSWFDEDGEATLAYKNLLNSFAIEEKNYRKTVSLNSEEDIEAAEKHIEKIKKQRDYVENLFDSAQKLKEAWIDNNEEIQDLFVEMNDALKEMRDTLLDKFMNQLEKDVEKTNKAYENNISKLESLITVQERYNDILNNSLDTQADLQKELQSNKDSYQYLDDYMRSIIFNEDDYKELSGELDNIMSKANDLAEEYQTKINSLTEDEMYKIEEITNEYERQVDELEKQYELKKAELDVVKAQTKLQNAQNERTVRMFVNGAWQWVADPNAIKEATEELSDAQKEADRIKREQEQLKEINKLEQEKDNNQLKIDLNDQLLEKVQETIEELTTETKTVNEWLELIAKEGVPMLHDIMAGLNKVGDIGNLLNNIGSNANLMNAASQNTTEAIKQGLLNGTLDPEQWAEKIGWIKGDNGKYYAPKDDPYYDPSGFDFGKVTPETTTTTDESGVQVQNKGNANTGAPSQNTNQFPKQGSVKDVSTILHIRSGAGMNYGIIGKIPPSGKPTILGESGGWAQVEYNGIKGWSSKDYLTYDHGGLMNGKGFALKDIIKPEAVLSPEQTKAWIKLVDNLTDPSLVHLTQTPKTESLYKPKDTTDKMIRDSYTFNNVTVQADNIEEFIASMQGYIPINNS